MSTRKSPTIVFSACLAANSKLLGFQSYGEQLTALASILMARKLYHEVVLVADSHWRAYFQGLQWTHLFTRIVPTEELTAYTAITEKVRSDLFWSTIPKYLALRWAYANKLSVALLDFDAILWRDFLAQDSTTPFVFSYREPHEWDAYQRPLRILNSVVHTALKESIGTVILQDTTEANLIKLCAASHPINTSFVYFSSDWGSTLLLAYLSFIESFFKNYALSNPEPIPFLGVDGNTAYFGELMLVEQYGLGMIHNACQASSNPDVRRAAQWRSITHFNHPQNERPAYSEHFTHLWKYRSGFNNNAPSLYREGLQSTVEACYIQWLLSRFPEYLGAQFLANFGRGVLELKDPVTNNSVYRLATLQ